jgi:uncharacterized OsmC-like protein
VEVTVTAEKLKHPARVGKFRMHVVCLVSLREEQTQGLMRSVHHCLVHHTVSAPPDIKIELAVAEPAMTHN